MTSISRPALRILGACWLIVLVSGCAGRVHYPYDAQRPRGPAATGYTNVYAYTPAPLNIKNHVRPDPVADVYRVRFLRFRASGNNGQYNNLVSGDYYQSMLPGKKPLVIVLPIWGVHTYPSDKLTDHIVEHSRGAINVYKMHGEQYLLDWEKLQAVEGLSEEGFIQSMEETAQRLHASGVDIRRLIHWAKNQGDVDARQIVLVGFSIGAMVAGSVLPHEPQLQGGVLVMGGARPQDIFARCPWRPGRARTAAMAKFGWSQRQYDALMERVFGHLDPARYGGRVDPAGVLIVDAREDECITRRSREALWQSMGYPERISLSYSHETAFLAMTPLGGNYLRKAIYRFLLKQFAFPAGR